MEKVEEKVTVRAAARPPPIRESRVLLPTNVDSGYVRNVCILAHVDHGKTTVADSLLATNAILSKRSAGLIRFLDDRLDEQERGITMKSSAVALYYNLPDDPTCYQINLIDTPGHIDFSTEVSAAVRICDGALIIVDLVEGVCVQTRDAIKQAFDERVKMILLLNKFDRLVCELNQSTEDIFQTIVRTIETCNTVIAELCQHDEDNELQEKQYMFSPETGNVIFASGTDGWGVTTLQLCGIFKDLVPGETAESLNEKIWNFDYYLDSKRQCCTDAIRKGKSCLFLNMCVRTLHHVYFTLVNRMERHNLDGILSKLGITNVTRDMKHTDPKIQVRAILQNWKPLAETILLQCSQIIPPSKDIDNERMKRLINYNRFLEDQTLKDCADNMLKDFSNPPDTLPTYAFVSKMFAVTAKNFAHKRVGYIVNPDDKKKQEELRTQEVKLEETSPDEMPDLGNLELQERNTMLLQLKENKVIALTRLYHGTLKLGQSVGIATARYRPLSDDSKSEIMQWVTLTELYIIKGRELHAVDEIGAGNICGIGGLDKYLSRSGTITSNKAYFPIADRSVMEPIVRNAIEPTDPKHLHILREGLKLLMLADSCVQVMTQESGELVIVSAGDVHLAKCLEDLKRFVPVAFTVSKPMVSLRETVISLTRTTDFTLHSVECNLPELGFVLSVAITPLPESIAKAIGDTHSTLRIVEEHELRTGVYLRMLRENNRKLAVAREKTFQTEHMLTKIGRVKDVLARACTEAGAEWMELCEHIWSVGKSEDCVNVLFNRASNYDRTVFKTLDETDVRSFVDSCIVNAFELLCRNGPICEEPLIQCGFIVNRFELASSETFYREDFKAQVNAKISVTVKDLFREAFQKQQQRLMEPIFTTDIQVNTSILGKVYTVISKRQGKVLDAVRMDEREKNFLVKAQIPVIESDGFANEIRKTTSGQANPNLRFSHFELINGNPFYQHVPEDEDEDDETVNIEANLRAVKLKNDMRRRKGLKVDDQVVIHAEKQRTLNKKK